MDKCHDHPHGSGLPGRGRALHEELTHHLPFSVSAVALGLMLAGIICFLVSAGRMTGGDADQAGHVAPQAVAPGPDAPHVQAHQHNAIQSGAEHDHANPFLSLFHLFHPAHMLFSAAATTAMFWRYERRLIKAVLIGLIGAIGVCGLSDIVIPQLSLGLLGKWMPWHICLIQHPWMILSFALVGVLVGLGASPGVHLSTFYWHSLHVFISSMASIFYLIGPFGALGWIDSIGTVFVFVIVAVMIPCCVSDIVFPLVLVSPARERYRDEHPGCGAAGGCS